MKQALSGLCCTAVLLIGCADTRDSSIESGTGVDPDTGGEPSDDDASGNEEKLDVGDGQGGGSGDCSSGDGEVEFTYIWIANTGDGYIVDEPATVSKIDTRSGEEVGRYIVDPNLNPQPSRTAVNLYGDAVVLSRGKPAALAVPAGPGAVTKVAARIEDCVDKNGNGSIETSSGPDDVLEFGTDECVLFHVPVPSGGYEQGPRPVGWEGSLSDGCVVPNPRLWIGWYRTAENLGIFQRLDGGTGETLDEVQIPWSGLPFGPYGGAVDGEGDFWALGWQIGPLVRIDGETLEFDRWEIPTPPGDTQTWTYGMALDPNGHPWFASLGTAIHFDPDTETFSFVQTTNQSMRGVMVDREHRAWFAVDQGAVAGADSCGLAVVDTQTEQVLADLVKIPQCGEPVGVSIDVDGFVWLVDKTRNRAYKVDPDSYEVSLQVEGLVTPYTYSDMTGAGLNLVTFPPAG